MGYNLAKRNIIALKRIIFRGVRVKIHFFFIHAVGHFGVDEHEGELGFHLFRDRLKAYAAAVESDTPQTDLTLAVARNLYKVEATPKAADMATYMLTAREKLAHYSAEEIKALSFDFPEPAPIDWPDVGDL